MNHTKTQKRIVVLGATGSVGRDVLEVVRQNPGDFEVVGLSCKTNIELCAAFAEEFRTKYVCSGDDDLKPLIENNVDLVVNCIAGEAGTNITRHALELGIDVALANKESLVSAGTELVQIARQTGATIIPIDSEICAIHQCLQGRSIDDVEKIILTASGGPFFGKTREELAHVTLDQALNHPTWPGMGRKITIDSATLMNKGFEVIETAVLFDINPDNIEVLIHPQSLVHGIVYFKDGNVIMHAASADMKIPIHYCLYYPHTKANLLPRLDLKTTGKLEFFEPDTDTFSNLRAAYNALRDGTTRQLLKENDDRVKKFLNKEISFTELFLPTTSK